MHDKIGAIRALEYMVPEPFRYTFSRTPLASEAPLVESTWRSWWEQAESKFPPLDADRRKVLGGAAATSWPPRPIGKSCSTSWRSSIGTTRRFSSDVLLGQETPLDEKAIAAMFLLLYNNKPLAVDVPLDATAEQVAEVSQNWLAHYEARQAEYQPTTGRKTVARRGRHAICPHGLAAGDVQFRPLGAENARAGQRKAVAGVCRFRPR